MELQPHLLLLSEPIRVRLLAVLAREELDVGELVRITQLPQSTVSRHLKALQTAGWVARRKQGTSSLFRMVGPEEGLALWDLVRADFEGSAQAREDEARLKAALQDRLLDPANFFGSLRERWEDVRADLFGEGFLLPTLLCLLPDGMVVADLGCGTGQTVAALSPVCARVIGVDRERAMLEVAALRTEGRSNVDLREGGLEALPLEDAEVDAALLMLVLHHVEHPAAALREARRVLEPGGRIVLLDMVAHDREDYRQSMGHQHLGFSRETLQDLASRAGLRIRSWQDLVPAPDAQGPPLFLATLA